MQSFRNILRWIFLLLALVFVVWTAPQMIHNLREWRAAEPGDPVAAEFWRSVFYMDLEQTAIVLGMGLLIWFGLRRRKRAAAPEAQM